MLVLSLCQKFCPDKIPVIPATKLGDGADGEVFDIQNDPEKVIKFCVRFELFEEDYDWFELYQQDVVPFLSQLIKSPLPSYARVYTHEYLGTYSRDFLSSPDGKQQFLLYYYIMEKLYKITEDEHKVFHSILSHEDRKIDKNYSLPKIKKMLQGLCCGLDFDAEKVILFCENLRSAPAEHLDIHSRNIMKDNNGNFKLIDFDRCLLGNV